MIALINLGLRLIRAGGRSAVIRMTLLALGAALSCSAVLFVAGMARVTDQQVVTEEASALRFSSFEQEPVAFTATEFVEFWEGERLRRVVVAGVDRATVTPPGVVRLPSPGEVVLSPELADLASKEPVVGRRFPQQRIGSIGPEGLASPNDLIAIVGVGPDELATSRDIAGFGVFGRGSERDPAATRVVALMLTVLILMPIAVFLSTCSRLAARSRDQRLATLRLLGLSPRRTQLVNAVEIGVGAFAGAAVGAIAFSVWTATTQTASIGSFAWWVDDMILPVSVQAGTVLLIALVAIGVAAASSQPGIANPLSTRRERAIRGVRTRRILPVIAGLTLLAVSWQRANDTPSVASWLPVFTAGMILTAVGLAIAAPFLSIAFGQMFDRGESAATMIAAGRLRHDPGAGARLVAGLAVSLFALGFAFSILEAFNADTQSRDSSDDVVALSLAVPPTTSVEIAEIDALANVTEVRPYPPSPGQAMVTDEGIPIETGAILIANCDTFQRLSGTNPGSCIEGLTYRIGIDLNGDGSENELPGRDLSSPRGYPVPDGTLVHSGSNVDWSITFLAPPSLQIPEVADNAGSLLEYQAQIGTQWLLEFESTSYDRPAAISAVAERFPGGNLSGFRFTVVSPDLPIYRAMVTAGAFAALAIGMLALVVATIDRSLERRRETVRLVALGTPQRTLDVAHLLHTIPVAVSVLLLASAGSAFAGASYLRIGGDDGIGIPATTITGLATGSLVGVATASGLGLVSLRLATNTPIRDD